MNTNNLFSSIISEQSSSEIEEEIDHQLFPSFLSSSTNNNNNNTTTKSSASDFNSNHQNLHSNLQSRQSEKEGVRFPEIPNFVEAIFTLLVCGFLLAAILIIIKKAKIWCASRHQGSERAEKEDEENPAELSTSSVSNNKQYNVNFADGSGTEESQFNSKESTDIDKIPQNANHSHTPNPNGIKLAVIEKEETSQDSKSYSRQSSSQSRDSRNSTKKGNQKSLGTGAATGTGAGKSPNRVSFVRRLSGPFGDECLEFVGETYKKLPEQKHYEEKESRAKRMSVRRMTKTPAEQKRRHGEYEGDKSGGESRSSSRIDEGRDSSNPASPTPSS